MRFKKSSLLLAVSSTLKLYLPKIANGPTVGAVRTITVKTMDTTGFSYEYDTTTLTALVSSSSATIVPTINIANSLVQQTSPEYVLTIPLGTVSLSASDYIYINFPKELPWTDTAATTATPTIVPTQCSAGFTTGTVDDYKSFIDATLRTLVYKSSSTQTGNLSICVKLGKSFYYQMSKDVSVSIIVSNKLVLQGSVALYTTPSTFTLTIAEKLYDSSVNIKTAETLYEIKFTNTGAILKTGSIAFLFEASAFTLSTGCHSLSATFTADAVCSKSATVTIDSVNYAYYQVSGFTADITASTAFTATMWATPALTATTPKVMIYTTYDGLSVDKLVDKSSIATVTIDTTTPTGILPPSVATLSPFVTPKIESRVSVYTVLTFDITPGTGVNKSTSTTSCGGVKVTMPNNGIVQFFDPATAASGTFTKAAGSTLECRFNTKLASKCVISSATPAVVTAYTPADTPLTSGQGYTLTIDAVEADTLTQRGFQAPANAGYYQFIVETFNCQTPTDTILEQAVPWVQVAAAGTFKVVTVTSFNKYAGDTTGLFISFKPTTLIPTAGGVVFLEFPVDKGDGRGWAFDLGTGLKNNDAIDCVKGATVSTFSCNLLHSRSDYVRIKVGSFGADAAADAVVDFTVVGLKNPTAVGYDLVLRIASYTWDETTLSNPKYTALDLSVYNYIDTTIAKPTLTDATDSATSLSAYTYDTDVSAVLQVTPPTAVSQDDRVLVKVPADFTPAASSTVCTYSSTNGACLFFPTTKWLLLKLSATPSTGSASVSIGNLKTPKYVSTITFTSYLFIDRKLAVKTVHTPSSQLAAPAFTAVTNNFSTLQKYATMTERYCFTATLETEIPINGMLTIKFPSAYVATSFVPDTFFIGPETDSTGYQMNVSYMIDGES